MNNSIKTESNLEENRHETNGSASVEVLNGHSRVHYASREELVNAARQYALASESFVPSAKDKELLNE
jgi:hypothetical protein